MSKNNKKPDAIAVFIYTMVAVMTTLASGRVYFIRQ